MATEGRATIVLSATDKTAAAFQSAKRNILGLQQTAAGIGAVFLPLLGAVGLLGSALSLLNFKSIVNGVDALNDLKDATGASIENLSALEDVAARTGTQFESVATALVKFNAQLKEAKPGSGPAEVLKAIGLSAEELKRIDPAEALRQTAVALAGFADDGNKARITQELFGKSIKEVAPFLNDLATQGQLNAKVTTAQAEAAEKFNHQLSALEKNIKDAAREIAGPMVQALNTLFAAIDGGERDVKELSAATEALLVPLQALTVLGANVGFVFKGLGREIGAIAAQGAALASGNLAAVGVIRDEVIADGKRARADLDDLEKRVLRIRDGSQAIGADFGNEGRNRPRPSAPDVPGKVDTSGIDKARTEALANLRKVTEGRVKTIAEGLENERDLQRFHEEFSKALYGQGTQSLEKFYADQDRARQADLAAVRRATAATIAARQEELDSPLLKGKDKQSERQEVENQINEARAKLRAAEREADQAGQLATIERQRATEALRDDVAALDAQIQALSGNAASADLLQIANQVRDAQRLLTQAGADPAQATRLGELLEAQRQLNIARENFGKVTRRASEEEERFLVAANARGDSQAEVERGLYAIRSQALRQLEEMARKQEEIAATGGPDSPAVQLARELRIEFERLNAVVDPALLRLRSVGDEVADALGRAAGAISLDFRNARSVVKSLGDALLEISTRELVTKPLTDLFRKEIRGLTEGSGSLAGLAGRLFGVGGGQAAIASTPPDAAGLTQLAATDALRNFNAAAEGGTSVLGALTAATTGSADVLGLLPQLAAIPATAALGTMSGAAQIATQALLQMAGAAAAGAAGSSGVGLLGLGGLIGGGGGFGSGANFGLQDLGLFLHKGGIAGIDGSVMRYHSGGIAGNLPNLQADEVPAILRRGEEVLTERDPRHRRNAASNAGNTYNSVDLRGLTVQSNGQMDRMAEDRAARNIARTAERYLSRRGA